MTKFSPTSSWPSTPSSKVSRRPISWPGRSSSSHSESSAGRQQRFVSEGPTFTSARIRGSSFATSGTSSSSIHPAPQPQVKSPPSSRTTTAAAESSVSSSLFESFIVRKSNHANNNSGTTTWIVKNIKPIPKHYPLDVNAITIDSSVPLSVICRRIRNFLRMNSICATYRPHRVDCVTMSMVKFAIQFWKGRPEGATRTSASSSGTTILEVQRRQGCSILMQHIRHGLVQAIVTDETPIVLCERKNVHNIDICAFVQEMYPQQQQQHKRECVDLLKCTRRLLQSGMYDQKQLGMESLLALTNPATVSIRDARLVCKAIVYGNPPLGDGLRNAVLPYFQNTERGSPSPEDDMEYDSDSDEDEEEYSRGSHFGAMHLLVLRILANVLRVVAELPPNEEAIELSLIDSPFWGRVCDALVYNIEVATHRPREAALSAQCLNLLAQLAPLICDCPITERLVPVLPDANAYGRDCNLLLERESLKLMGTLSEAS